jgi:D-amino-acid dehydrogenase
VIEQAQDAGMGCSFANGGQLSYSYAEPLASPSFPGKLPGLLWGKNPPLRVKLSAFPDLGLWGAAFLRHCSAGRFAANTAATLRLALYSRERMEALRTSQPLEFDYRHYGKLHLYPTEAALERVAPLCAFKNRFGCDQRVLTTGECLALEPALSPIRRRIAGAVFSPLDASGDALRFVRALAQLGAQEGISFDYATRVLALRTSGRQIEAVETDRGRVEADAYVLCLGARSAALTRPLGLNLPIVPGKGYSLTLSAAAGDPRVNITDTQHRLVYSRLGEALRVAGVMEFAGFDLAMSESRERKMLTQAELAFPSANRQVLGRWAGLRPMTPDSAPLIGKTPYANLYLNTGHGMLGWTLACGSAAALADIASGKQPAIDLDSLALARFG